MRLAEEDGVVLCMGALYLKRRKGFLVVSASSGFDAKSHIALSEELLPA